MAAPSLGWGVQDVGRRMSDEIRIGGRAGEMPYCFSFVLSSIWICFTLLSVVGSWGRGEDQKSRDLATCLFIISRCECFETCTCTILSLSLYFLLPSMYWDSSQL